MSDNSNEFSSKNKSIANNMIWSVVERVTSQVLATIVSIVLARLLYPEDYASVALVTVFVNLASVAVTSGFSSALIYDNEQSVERYSTAFYAVLMVTGCLYVMLYISAPFLAGYYGDNSLINIIRTMSLLLVFQGIYSILYAYVSKNMLFKKTYKATFFGAIISTIVSIMLALNGYGVWALVFLPMIEVIISSAILWKSIHFQIVRTFKIEYVKFMIHYCIKFVLVDLLNALYSSLNSLVIAKKYSKADLSYYSKAYNLPQMLFGSVNTAISKVLFPTFSESKDNLDILKQKLRMGIQLTSYVIMPMLCGLMMISKSVVVLLFTDKWIGMVPYLQIMCMVWVFQPVQICAIQVYKAIGQGETYLKLELYKKILPICILIVCLSFAKEPIVVAWVLLVGQVISCVVNMPYLKKFFSYSYREQIKDLGIPMILCGIMCLGVYFIGIFFNNVIIKMFVQIFIGITFYVSISAVSKNSSFLTLLKLILQLKNSKNERKKM